MIFLIFIIVVLIGLELYRQSDADNVVDSILSDMLGRIQAVMDAEQSPTSTPIQSSSTYPAALESKPVIKDAEIETDKYIYRQLSEPQQEAYRRIYTALLTSADSAFIPIDTYDNLGEFEIIDLYNAVLSDSPEIYWAGNGITTHTQTINGVNAEPIEVQLQYLYEGAELERIQSKIDAYADECLAGMPYEGSDFDKILYIYEYVVTHTEYNKAYANSQSIVSTMLERQAVCAGYAKSVQYLLNLAGIPCTTVDGFAQGESHGWNLVRADGEYYYLDATWGDAWLDAIGNDSVSYDYFLMTSEEMALAHTPEVKYLLPVCTATRLNYYVHTGRMFDGYDYESILSVVAGDISTGKDWTTFRFASQDAYETARTALFENREIFSILKGAGSGSSGAISYALNDDLRIITIAGF